MPDGSGDAYILSLPPDLQRVPGFHTLEDDSWRGDPKTGWFSWRDQLEPWREDVQLQTETDHDFRADERLLCAADPKYWMAMWGWVYEPRARKAQGKHVPFTPFAFQCHVMDWLVALADNPDQADGFVTKSRGIGLSWTIVSFAVWGWAFHDVTTLLLSRTQSEVDKPNNINTLFGKALYMIDNMPDWLLPPGFSRDRDRTQMNIANPDSHAQIFGDSTTAEAGRGDRASIAFVDEAAFIRELRDVWTTLDGTTDHTVSVSTETLKYGTTWLNSWENAKLVDPDSVFVLDWWLNPHQDEAWREREYARREKKLDLPGYYTEIERNPFRGRSSIIYPEARTVTFDGPPYDPSLPIICGIDPGMVDDTAIIWGQTEHGDHRTGKVNWLDSYERNGMQAEFYAIVLTGLWKYVREGDPGWGYDFRRDRRLMDLMEWMITVPWHKMRVVMDPAGKQTDSGALSFQMRIYQFSKALRQRWLEDQQRKGVPLDKLPKLDGVYPLCEKIIALNAHQPRHNAARELLSRSTFTDSPGARRIVTALMTYRMGELTAKATREPVPIHDDDASHLATAFEWVATYRGAGYLRPRPEPKRREAEIEVWERVA